MTEVRSLPQPFQYLHSVHIGKRDIQHDQIRSFSREGTYRFLTAAISKYPIFIPEKVEQKVAVVFRIFHDGNCAHSSSRVTSHY